MSLSRSELFVVSHQLEAKVGLVLCLFLLAGIFLTGVEPSPPGPKAEPTAIAEDTGLEEDWEGSAEEDDTLETILEMWAVYDAVTGD